MTVSDAIRELKQILLVSGDIPLISLTESDDIFEVDSNRVFEVIQIPIWSGCDCDDDKEETVCAYMHPIPSTAPHLRIVQ